jgi:alpha-beta hydrolase superfamily lysophospholipase
MTVPLPGAGRSQRRPKAHSAGFAQIIGDFINAIGLNRQVAD